MTQAIDFTAIQVLMEDKEISDILINGFKTIFYEKRGALLRSSCRFDNEQKLHHFIQQIAHFSGRDLTHSSMLDARLPDGSRVNIITPPSAVDGITVSIRRFTQEKLTLDTLCKQGVMTSQTALLLRWLVEAKINIVISGGTGSGKTTMMNILSSHISDKDRIITIEDAAELSLRQPHVIRLETTPADIHGQGEINASQLLKNSLRMRPDRIIIGEVRGEETITMLQAMNTGHHGSLTTIHSNSPRDALTRIENMIMMSGHHIPLKALRGQLSSALNIILQMHRLEDGQRALISIQEVDHMEGDLITMAEIFRFQSAGFADADKIKGELKATGIVPRCVEQPNNKKLQPLDRSIFE